jgi:uncharacterized protein (TIGR02145 family)
MKTLTLYALLFALVAAVGTPQTQAQTCTTEFPPENLVATYTPEVGVLLQWDAIPGSLRTAVVVEFPSGFIFSRRLAGFELSQLFIPDTSLTEFGVYQWRVVASCNFDRPFDFTPLSDFSTFEKIGGPGPCDPFTAPDNLITSFVQDSAADFSWDPVISSLGVNIEVAYPSGLVIERRVIGPDVNEFSIPDSLLVEFGTYNWRVQAACNTERPFVLTPFSAPSSFTRVAPFSCPANVTDLDSNAYAVVELFGQCWMAENLRVTQYNNGDAIPTNIGSISWSNATVGGYALYNNDEANRSLYGLLYNQYAVVDARGICPTGWHVPNDDEWNALTDSLGGALVAGGELKTTGTVGAGTGLWLDPNGGATNNSGFSALPGGSRAPVGTYGLLGSLGFYWGTTTNSATSAWARKLNFQDATLARENRPRTLGASVRCVQD